MNLRSRILVALIFMIKLKIKKTMSSSIRMSKIAHKSQWKMTFIS